ncbi:Crp/Fnr family transcriptional regulator [Okeania sp. SIO3B5]|uniref:Crp/Fnr family transcriptional regulator n=1 Tax=Okeania sp. SIO3B5 TaxID=2607811 RepID=UPI0025E46F43|nr:Crp/Fnr family transcriptional regulator [Okeania sp. SIO3B5]
MSLNSVVPKPYPLKQHQFKRRQLIPLTDVLLWRIDSGVVRTLTKNEEENTITLGFWGPGDIVGQPLFPSYPYQVECLTIVEASILPRGYFYTQEVMLSHIQKTQELLRIIHSRKIKLRLLRLLKWLADRFGNQLPDRQILDIRFTHQELADIIGTSRVTVTRLLNQFEKEQKIGWSQNNCLILFNRHLQ